MTLKNFKLLPLGAALLGAALMVVPGQAKVLGDSRLTPLEHEVRHEIVMLPLLSVFDNIEFQVNGDEVTLMGSVYRPSLKKSAERVVAELESVGKVVNNIEILPTSPNDDRIRWATYRAIYSYPGLDRYAMQSIAPIRIVVKNGDVALEGVVAREADKNLAGILANGVPGVFSVKNHLKLEQ